MSEISRVGVSFESDLLDEFDNLIGDKGYDSRSEAIRDLVREFISQESLKKYDDQPAAGSITIVYDHDASNVLENLIEIQHHSDVDISGTTHVHLDEDNCLEVVVARGGVKHLKELADKLSSLKGVKYGDEAIFQE